MGADGAPIGLRIADCGLRIGEASYEPIASIREIWRIDDEWWREPITRIYYDVLLHNGARMVLFQNLITEEWFSQMP
jgi:hypothetical protein